MPSAVTQPPTPSTEAPEQDRMLGVLAWIELHRKHLMTGFVALLFVFAAVYLWRHLSAERELAGNSALLELRGKLGQPDTAPKAAEFLAVAERHASTSAGVRARLLAAAALFAENRYSEAQAEFARVLDSEGSGTLAAQAAYGVAACLDAQDRTDEAVTRYQEILARFPEESVVGQARLAMARVHESRKQYENALRFYDEVLKDRESTAFVPAATQAREELIRRHPELAPNSTNAVGAPVSVVPLNK